MPTPGQFFAGGRGAVASASGAMAKDGKREEGAKSGERAGNDADAFFNDRPETNFPGAEHEFGGVAVQAQVA